MGVRAYPVVLPVDGVQKLIDLLRGRGLPVVGPTPRDGVIVHAPITSLADLPTGTGDDQAPGRYRLRARGDGALFGYAVPASSWKHLFLPPREVLLGDGPATDPVPVALFGVRSCDLAALDLHDRALLRRPAVDVRYARRRQGTVVVAVTCTEPSAMCFCAGLRTGPEPSAGYDVRLTELTDGGHRFLAVPGTPLGEDLLAEAGWDPAAARDVEAAADAVRDAAGRMRRAPRLDGLREDLYGAADLPHWEQVGSRCLACAGCTLVCPTCFCTTVEDTSGVRGEDARRIRVWDSCFTAAFSYLHGGSVRESIASRYRQWITHKFATWTDQFGVLGCVGCGRCTTWCPAGIDLLAELAAVRGLSAPPGDRRVTDGTETG
ncbi:MAG: hypothetical protein QG622_262 [Actinomycetota bacterium]|nr:hypothetical protein [Actinomycetota bacterium]